jgi:hypothetical protein
MSSIGRILDHALPDACKDPFSNFKDRRRIAKQIAEELPRAQGPTAENDKTSLALPPSAICSFE